MSWNRLALVALAILSLSFAGCIQSEEEQNLVEKLKRDRDAANLRMKLYPGDVERLKASMKGAALTTALGEAQYKNDEDKARVTELNLIIKKLTVERIPIAVDIALAVCLIAAIAAMLDSRKCRAKLAAIDAAKTAPPADANPPA